MLEVISFFVNIIVRFFNFLNEIVIYESLTLFKLLLVIIIFKLVIDFFGGKKND